ncbi:MAG: BON domain-containing protein [Syntrophobacterales bacterium]|nr:BON domain-containing protein [Syntrophobacterales bacterium]
MGKRRIFQAIMMLILIQLFCSCVTPAGRTPGEVIDDTNITATIKKKLFEDPYLSGLAISVTTFKGEVTLMGAVDNQFEKNRAEAIASSIMGVKKVNNLLEIKK